MSPSLISGSGEDGCLDSEAGVDDWGHKGCYDPAEDVSTYKGCERCQPTAPCCQLARPGAVYRASLLQRPQSIPGPRSQRASESFMFSLQLASACMTHFFFLQCTVRRFRGRTNISAEWSCCSSALFAAVMNLSFVYIASQTALPLASISASVRLMFSQSD